MTNYLPSSSEDINSEYERLIRETPKKKAPSKKGEDDVIPKVEATMFDEYFTSFKNWVEDNGRKSFDSFSNNDFLIKQEGYKDLIYTEARKVIDFDNWTENDIGTGKIFGLATLSLRTKPNKETDNNLLDWRLADYFESKSKSDGLKDIERVLFDLFHSNENDADIFAKLVELLGKNYPLIGYFFFIKDKTKYAPISPENVDLSLVKLKVAGFKTTRRCSWKNYIKYLDVLDQIRDLLTKQNVKDVSLLDAHSFVWVISDIEKKLAKLENK